MSDLISHRAVLGRLLCFLRLGPAWLLSSQMPSSVRSLAHACSVDNGDEVKFNVELCRIKNLPGLYLLNIKRLRGSVWSFKFIYQTVIE